MRKRINTKDWPVMAEQCPSCPFRVDQNGCHPDVTLVSRIMDDCLTKASQICHHPRLYGQRETHLCRGARNFQLTIFYRLGVLEAPTDKAWAKLSARLFKR